MEDAVYYRFHQASTVESFRVCNIALECDSVKLTKGGRRMATLIAIGYPDQTTAEERG